MEKWNAGQVRKTKKGVWTGRRSAESNLYFHEQVQMIANTSKVLKGDIVLLGYACDEGVRRNLGRPGAEYGPIAIKSALAKTAFTRKILDLGDILVEDDDMESAQEVLGRLTSEIILKGGLPVNIGGGHDIAFGTGSGVVDAVTQKGYSLGIFNFDAHFDLRKPYKEGNSGTPFYQLYQLAQSKNLTFNYNVLGIQRQSNTQDLFATADFLKVNYLSDEQLTDEDIKSFVEQATTKVDKIYITIDLDVLNVGFAPGVSAINPMGLSPSHLIQTLRLLFQTGKIYAIDIAEMNPNIDIDGRTAKLAAYIINEICNLFLSYPHES